VTYVELHAHSSYSFCDGASLPQELAHAAAERGYEAFALTDHDGVYGAMEFAQACEPLGVRPIHGAELTVICDGARRHLTLLVADATGWENLCRLVTEAHAGTRPRPDREPLPPEVALESVLERNEGLVCLTGCARDGLLVDERGLELGNRLVSAFGRERVRVELQRPLWRHDRARNRRLAGIAERLGVPCVATGNVHSHSPARAALQDALVAVRNHSTLEECEAARRGNASSVMVAPAAMAARFADHPEAVAETARLAERLRFDLRAELG
jgi:error-prone DNA polymerase